MRWIKGPVDWIWNLIGKLTFKTSCLFEWGALCQWIKRFVGQIKCPASVLSTTTLSIHACSNVPNFPDQISCFCVKNNTQMNTWDQIYNLRIAHVTTPMPGTRKCPVSPLGKVRPSLRGGCGSSQAVINGAERNSWQYCISQCRLGSRTMASSALGLWELCLAVLDSTMWYWDLNIGLWHIYLISQLSYSPHIPQLIP